MPRKKASSPVQRPVQEPAIAKRPPRFFNGGANEHDAPVQAHAGVCQVHTHPFLHTGHIRSHTLCAAKIAGLAAARKRGSGHCSNLTLYVIIFFISYFGVPWII